MTELEELILSGKTNGVTGMLSPDAITPFISAWVQLYGTYHKSNQELVQQTIVSVMGRCAIDAHNESEPTPHDDNYSINKAWIYIMDRMICAYLGIAYSPITSDDRPNVYDMVAAKIGGVRHGHGIFFNDDEMHSWTFPDLYNLPLCHTAGNLLNVHYMNAAKLTSSNPNPDRRIDVIGCARRILDAYRENNMQPDIDIYDAQYVFHENNEIRQYLDYNNVDSHGGDDLFHQLHGVNANRIRDDILKARMIVINSQDVMNALHEEIFDRVDEARDADGVRIHLANDFRIYLSQKISMFDAQCPLCRREFRHSDNMNKPIGDIHHIHQVCDGGQHQLSNLIYICATCHNEHHRIASIRESNTIKMRQYVKKRDS